MSNEQQSYKDANGCPQEISVLKREWVCLTRELATAKEEIERLAHCPICKSMELDIDNIRKKLAERDLLIGKKDEALDSARNAIACMSEYIAHKGLPFAFNDSVRESGKLVEVALYLSYGSKLYEAFLKGREFIRLTPCKDDKKHTKCLRCEALALMDEAGGSK